MNKLFAYPGGKWPIRHLVVSAFPKHKTYVDVFGGSAAILLTKERSDGEVFNDKNQMLVNFFRVVKHRPAELAERARHWIHSRELWNEVLSTKQQPLDEIERAFLFWTRLQDSFGACGRTFGTAREGIHSVTKSREYIDEVSARLRTVHIESCSFERCIKLYDGPGTFFYLDPPYPNTKGGDGNYDVLSIDEWKSMRKILGNVEGRFLLSCNADPFVLDLFKKYRIKKITVRVTLSRKKDVKRRQEILVSNYSLPKLKHHAPVYMEDAAPVRDKRDASLRKSKKECAK
jgi:DNA adenine methylase